MSLANGRPLLAMPGPTNIPDRVLQAMMRPAEELSSDSIVSLTETVLSDLKRVFRTDGETFVYAAKGHGGWEAAFTNVLSRGDRVLVLESGRFAVGWGEMARFIGVDVEVLPGSWRRAVDPAAVEALPSTALPVPGVGRSRWLVELIRARAGESADFELEACDDTGRLGLPPELVDRSVSADGWRRGASA